MPTDQQLRDEVARLLDDAARPAKLNEIPEAMEKLRVGRSTVFALMASGQLRSVKIGRRRLIPEQALRDFIAGLDDA